MKDKKRNIGLAHAIAGIVSVYRSEKNFRIHVLAMILVVFASIILRLSFIEWALIIVVTGAVLITELINTVIEKIIDYIKPEIHPTAKFIKDAAAGSVLISSICAVIIGILIFFPKLNSFF